MEDAMIPPEVPALALVPAPEPTVAAPVPADVGPPSPSAEAQTPAVGAEMALTAEQVASIRAAHEAVDAAAATLGYASLEWERRRLALLNTVTVADHKRRLLISTIALNYGLLIGDGAQGCHVDLARGTITRTR